MASRITRDDDGGAEIMIIPSLKMKNGAEIPALGFGTWQLTGDTCKRAVETAIGLGYRHIDTAEIYQNEQYIGEAIGGRPEPLFLASKVFYHHLQRDDVFGACLGSLHRLGTALINLYLVHFPNSKVPMRETFEALEGLMQMGLLEGIGVSNFTIKHLKEATVATQIPILVNQLEFHPFLYQKELLDYCKQHDIVLTAYSPLARGLVYKNETIQKIAQKHNKTPGQISLRWCVEKGCVVIPKASSEAHIRENMAIFDFLLDEEDHRQLDNLPQQRLVNPPWGELA
jgi:diketogulonate reductase-like aldo/keto reductase